jgi:hypothetical protein
MILGLSISAFTLIHVVISLIALASGFVVLTVYSAERGLTDGL